MTNYIQLDRQFSLLPRNKTDEHFEYQSESIYSDKLQWESLLLEYRTVILAEAGAGKTTEFIQQAKKLEAEGKFSFFIRIEKILDKDFIEFFLVGDEDSFDEWLQSTDEAWFFLDSVDEARLKNSEQFHDAIRRFSRKIKLGAHRCHIYISSRPYSWRFREDEELLNYNLLYSVPKNDNNDQLGEIESTSLQEDNQNNLQDQNLFYSQKNLNIERIKSSLKVYTLCPLNRSQIEQFCSVRSVENIKLFLDEIQKYNLISLAERPFDLETMTEKWKDDKKLGSRTEVIQHNIYSCLLNKHNEDRTIQAALSRDKLEEGVQRIASMVTLTGKSNIRVPNSPNNNECIDASELLPEWDKDSIDHLVNSAIFNDVIYGAVRFRHREIREFLTAQWFKKLLNADNRFGIESLFIREQFREQIITPLLRPILPWLIPYDEKLRSKILQIQPEIAFEGGDFFQLTLDDREKFLEKLVDKIASSQGYHGMIHNDDIARIASKDIENKTDILIQQYSSNKDVIFFLARLVWKGKMTKCLSSLFPIALDINNDVHTRAVCVRAIMDCSDSEGQIEIWHKLNEFTVELDHRVLVELIAHVEPDAKIIQLLLTSLEKANRPKKYEPSGLMQILVRFLEECDEISSFQLLKGLVTLLFTKPFYQNEYCYISEKYSWLVKITLKTVIHLLKLKSILMLDPQVIAVLIHVRALEYKQDFVESYEYSISDEKHELERIIPMWQELNDQLYWQSIETVRNYQNASIGDDWSISWMGCFWSFGINDFERLVGYVQTKQLMDDKLIAFNRAFKIYSQNDNPIWMVQQLKDISTEYPMLEERLNIWLNPPTMKKSHETIELEAEYEAQKQKFIEQNHQEKLAKKEWVKSLCNDPNRLSGELIDDHILLMYECKVTANSHTSWGMAYTNWKSLISEFGEIVAYKYYDSVTKFWRMYKPKLNSEENIEKGSIPTKLVFGLTGLEIESREDKSFPNNLNADEVENALRYITWEINGFPTWFERMYQVFPKATVKAVMKETIWALQNSEENLLSNVLYTAQWLHADLALEILNYILGNQIPLLGNTRKYTLGILLNGEIKPEQFSDLAFGRLVKDEIEDQAFWYALLVDSNPEQGIKLLEKWLGELPTEEVELAAQIFITNLMNHGRADQFAINGRAGRGIIRTAKYLKQLYLIIHRYIKTEADIDRSNGDVYSPTLRDNAQDSRYLIFQYLSEIADSESYHAIKELANQESSQSRAIWMHQVTYRIAISCGNFDPFSIDQVLELERSAIIDPKNHKELFDLALIKIHTLKDWLENGDDSPFFAWQAVENETKMRILIAGQLGKESLGKYTISQEYEIANGQRPDIRFDKPNITSVPVELKILDKQWSGNDLCERLRNQLIGDYLREETAGCGIFLLVAQNIEKTWKINGKQVTLSELEGALQEYWHSIAHEWPKIDSIKVIVIDLNKRSLVSKT